MKRKKKVVCKRRRFTATTSFNTTQCTARYLGSIIASIEIVCEEKPRARLPTDHDKKE